MRALQVAELSGPDGLRLAEVPKPSQGAGLLVETYAAGLSYGDILKSRGQYQKRQEPPYTLGTEFAGVVTATIAGCALEVGDRVAGFTAGAAAEVVIADPRTTLRLPERLSFEEGAALPLNYSAAVVALAMRGRIRSGETVLVHGAAGGTGSAAIQVAKALGARVIGVVSSDEKARVATAAGADEVVRANGPWKDDVLRLTGGRGVEIVFDPVGGDRYLDTIRALAVGGRWVVIGFVGGPIPQVALNRILLRNIDVVGSYYDGFLSSDPTLQTELTRQLVDLLASGWIRPVVGRVYPLEAGVQALRDLDERRATGKVVLTLR